MNSFAVSEPIKKVKIITIGVGSNAAKTIEYMRTISCYTIDTILVQSPPSNYDEIREALKDAGLVFITTALDDSTELSICLHIAKIAKEAGALTISVIPQSFCFTNKEESELVRARLDELEKWSDAILNPSIKLLARPIRAQPVLKTLNDIIVDMIEVISGIVIVTGPNDITLDLDDLKVVLRGPVIAERIEYTGKSAATKGITSMINSYFSNNIPTSAITGVLVSFKIHPDFSVIEFNEAMNVIEDLADSEANIIFGTTTDETLALDYVSATMIVSYFKEEFIAVNDESFKAKK